MYALGCFGPQSIDYLTQCWSRGERFRCELSDSLDFVGSVGAPEEVFTPIVIADLFMLSPRPLWLTELLTQVSVLTAAVAPVHFFREPSLLPPDTDCTALAFSVSARAGLVNRDVLERSAQMVAENTTSDGIIQVYFDRGGEREGIVDAVVCANALHLLHLAGQGWRAQATEEYLRDQLEQRRFVDGTRYYPSPDTFLYFLTRLVTAFPAMFLHWLPVVRARIRERQGVESRPLELAQRVLAAARLGMDPSIDAWNLQRQRSAFGGFPPDALFRCGRRARYFGGEAITTAFAARALLEYGRSLNAQQGRRRYAGGTLQRVAAAPAGE